jgi:hypothetical protein
MGRINSIDSMPQKIEVILSYPDFLGLKTGLLPPGKEKKVV